MNGDALKELGLEVAMGGVDAPADLLAACEEAAAKATLKTIEGVNWQATPESKAPSPRKR